MENQCNITFNGKELPVLDSIVYIIRRTMKRNKNGRPYSAKSPFDIELVEATISKITCQVTCILDEHEWKNEIIWSGEAFINSEDDNCHFGPVVFNAYNYSTDKAEGKKQLTFYKDKGFCYMHNDTVELADRTRVTENVFSEAFDV